MAEQNQDVPPVPSGRITPATLAPSEGALLRAFCAWLRDDGLAICRDVGADRWAPTRESAAALVVAFDAHLQEQEEQGDWGG